ncbi:MAG: DUF2029 domain-containing protein [Planctomycetes bacterium]|nr:DUF2029 domain-containing protein [Planctomycetota bacterium]
MAIGVVLAIGQVGYATIRALGTDSDLIGFHETAVHLGQTGEITSATGWKYYLPASAILLWPLLVWPMWVTAPLWALINVGALWWTLRECGRLAGGTATARGEAPRTGSDFHLRWTLPLAAVFAYAVDAISLGQLNVVVLALCVAGYSRCARRGCDLAAGAMVGLAATIKLFPLILAVFWLVGGRWKASLATLFWFALLVGGPSLAVLGMSGSVEAHRAWLARARGEPYAAQAGAGDSSGELDHLMFRRKPHQWMRHNNQGLAAVVRRLTTNVGRGGGHEEPPVNIVDFPLAAAYGLYLAVGVIVFALLVKGTWQSRHLPDAPGAFAAWLAAVVALLPVFWTHYFILALPALALLCRAASRDGKRSLPGLLLLAWVAGELLLASRPARLVGVQCWLTLALALWAVHHPRPVALPGAATDPEG